MINNKGDLKSLLLESNFLSGVSDKQNAYIQLKVLIDELYIEDIYKCKTDVCTVIKHTFVEKKDVYELLELAEDMCMYISKAKQVGLSNDSLIKIRSYFSLISLTLEHYKEVGKVSEIMKEFSILLNEYKESFANLNSCQIELLEGFSHNFERWVEIMFVLGGEELHSFDDSLRSDFNTIKNMIEPINDISIDLNDIFDF